MGAPQGFTPESWAVVQRKPEARILDYQGTFCPLIFSKHFPADYFHCVVFDPPHHFGNALPYSCDPKEDRSKNGTWWGLPFKNHRDMVVKLYHAQTEFSKLSLRLCMKWCETRVKLSLILTLFDRWEIVFAEPVKSKRNHYNDTSVYWVKMVRRGGASF